MTNGATKTGIRQNGQLIAIWPLKFYHEAVCMTLTDPAFVVVLGTGPDLLAGPVVMAEGEA